MGDLLGFFKPGLALLQVARQRLVLLVCTPAVSDVLDRTEYFVPSPRGVSFHSPDRMYSAQFADGADDTMFHRSIHSTANDTFNCLENMLPIVRVHHFADQRHVNGALLWRQSVDAIKFGGPSHAVRDEVPLIVTDLGDTLGLLQPCFAFLKVPGQYLTLVIGSFALCDVCHHTGIFEAAGAVSSCMRNYVDVFDDPVRAEDSMFDIQIHATLRGMIPKLLQASAVLGVNSVEYEIECRVRFSRETQNFVGFVR